MPVTGPGSYLSTMDDFLPHWEQVNLTLGAGGPLVVRNPNGPVPPTLARAILEGWRADLAAKHTELEGQINNVEIAWAELKAMKAAIHLRATQFNEKVRSELGDTAYADALPVLAAVTDGMALFLKPLDDISTLWAKINAAAGIAGFTPPLKLLGDYDLAAFDAELALLRAKYPLVSRAEFLVSFKISERNRLQDQIYPLLKAYRLAVPTRFAANDPLVLTLPKLTPDPGSTPEPVLANGLWVPAEEKAKLTWDASTDPNLAEYEVRWSPGTSYDAANEVVLGSVAKDAPREFLTAQGLATPGAVSVFKVYVKITTGNERGSNTVKITRP